MYWEPAKYVAKLRALKTDRNPLLLKTIMEAGHGGASGRYDQLKDVAFDYAYVLQALLAAMIVVAALLGGWRLTRGQLKTCPECLSEIPHDASICRYRTSELLEIPR